MEKIAITSKVKLKFPPRFTGYVEMRIPKISNLPEERRYELNIVDTCYDYEEEEVENYPEDYDTDNPQVTKETVKTRVDYHKEVRVRSYSYDDLNQLAKLLNLDKTQFETETLYINELFRHGLLLMTQKECMEGISGPGLGMHFSKANQWVIVR